MSSDSHQILRESISALMDGEVAELEMRRTLGALANDPDLRATWHRYQLISMAMRGDLPGDLVDLSKQIGEAIDAEPAHRVAGPLNNAVVATKKWISPLGRIAVAASVAVMAVFVMQKFQSEAPAANLVAATQVDRVQTVSETEAPSAKVASNEVQNAPSQVLPGFHFPRVSARTVSLDSSPRPQQRVEMVGSQTLVGPVSPQQIQFYLNALIQNHAERESFGTTQAELPLGQAPASFDQDVLH
jgi:sigma-E factor negative regulatory protein RseA